MRRNAIPALYLGMEVWTKIENKIRAIAKNRGYGCDACGAELFDYPRRRVCAACEKSLRKAERVCDKCGRETVAGGVCLTCKSHIPLFTQGFSPFAYKGGTAALVNRVKNGDRRLAFFLGEEMAETLAKNLSAREILLVPVPLTKARRRERGYNQAEELAFSVLDRLHALGYSATLLLTALEKRKDGKSQKHLGFLDRAKNVLDAFHLRERKSFKDKTVVLIDDIMTTGATGSECARLLRNAGAAEVYFLVAAALPE
ncbi:MAG: ComF family protein [Clostridia bacterium]|nr:ComF family protein [Clostridia bacterium]